MIATVDRARTTYDVVDILVNNAGYSYHHPPEDMPRAQWQHVLDACLSGTFYASKAVARELIAAGRPGAIVNLSSISGSTSLGRGIFAYGAAKAGIDGLTRDLAIEWASYGIRVNSVAPCQVRTEGFASVADKQSSDGDGLVDRVLRGIPIGRLAESERRRPRHPLLGQRRRRDDHRRGAAGGRRQPGDEPGGHAAPLGTRARARAGTEGWPAQLSKRAERSDSRIRERSMWMRSMSSAKRTSRVITASTIRACSASTMS